MQGEEGWKLKGGEQGKEWGGVGQVGGVCFWGIPIGVWEEGREERGGKVGEVEVEVGFGAGAGAGAAFGVTRRLTCEGKG